jgi:tetratricopeptide (TPR) repeat protein
VSSRLAIIFVLAASLGGRNLCAQTRGGASSGMAAAQGFADAIPRPEDSSETHAVNLLFYDNPRGAEVTPAPVPAGTVSVEQLQHPVSRKGAKILNQASNFAAMGRHDKAMQQLQLALQERSAIPYAHSMLGAEYLKIDQLRPAIVELEQAVALLPRNVPDHSNLGYALYLAGDLDRAETETRQALDLDHDNAKTQFVLSQILRARKLQARSLP